MKNYKRSLLALSLCACALVAVAQNELTVKITNVPSSQGKVLVATSKGQYAMAEAKSPETQLIIKGVPMGEYKFYAYHDENGNFQLDEENGIPREFCVDKTLKIDEGTKAVEMVLTDVRGVVKKLEK